MLWKFQPFLTDFPGVMGCLLLGTDITIMYTFFSVGKILFDLFYEVLYYLRHTFSQYLL